MTTDGTKVWEMLLLIQMVLETDRIREDEGGGGVEGQMVISEGGKKLCLFESRQILQTQG